MKSIFARQGMPEMVVSDNAPQFASKEFAEFAAKWELSHITSSPRFPKANGLAERTVETIKKLLAKSDMKNEDPYLVLLAHRSCPDLNGDPSPAAKLMDRQLRTRLPAVRPLKQNQTSNQMKNMKKNVTKPSIMIVTRKSYQNWTKGPRCVSINVAAHQ